MTTKATAPTVHTLDGNGRRALLLQPAPKHIGYVEVLVGEDFERLPASDYSLKGNQLALSDKPSGMASVFPKGQGTVKVHE
jgi:hypothetical protein